MGKKTSIPFKPFSHHSHHTSPKHCKASQSSMFSSRQYKPVDVSCHSAEITWEKHHHSISVRSLVNTFVLCFLFHEQDKCGCALQEESVRVKWLLSALCFIRLSSIPAHSDKINIELQLWWEFKSLLCDFSRRFVFRWSYRCFVLPALLWSVCTFTLG